MNKSTILSAVAAVFISAVALGSTIAPATVVASAPTAVSANA